MKTNIPVNIPAFHKKEVTFFLMQKKKTGTNQLPLRFDVTFPTGCFRSGCIGLIDNDCLIKPASDFAINWKLDIRN
ncbi:MAG: hypothetical protein AB9834_08335 [Lentimicrobium sp.]